ncbi:pentapeptide repeat-containing protein [Campylobacter coli]
MRKALEKILNTLEKCCEETHQNGKSESDINKSDDEVREQLFDILLKNNPRAIKECNIFISGDEKTKETIKEIKGKEDFRQRDGLFSDDEKWYLICDEEGSKIDISLSYDKIKSIPCNVIFNNCNIDLRAIKLKDLKKDNAETIKNHLYFYNCTFEKALIKLESIIFEKTLTFNQCKFKRKARMYKNRFLSHLVFINCSNEQNDKKIISLDLQENEFEGYLFIKNCTIKNISLWKNKFKNRCYFVDSKFGYKDNQAIKNYIIEKINLWKNKFKSMCCCVDSNFGYKDEDNTTKLNFSNTHFEDEVYFNNSEFYNYADFHECTFDNIACFYGVKFYKAPNFSQVVLKGNLNALNITSNFVFDDLEKQIDQEYEDFNKDKKEQDKKPLYKFSNDFRDSFRTFKNTLIKDNNLLDASNFHKYELYCKELELKNKKATTFKDIVDRYQLFFYRKLCDHHTDLLKAFHNLLIVIMLFGMFSFVFDKFKQSSHIENDIKYKIVKVDSNENYIFKEHNKTTYNLLSLNIEQEIQDLDISKFCFTFTLGLLFAVAILSNANCLWFLFLLLLEVIVFYIGLPKSIFSHLLIILSFVCLFVFILVLDDEFERFLFVSISYAVCIFILLAKPSLLLPIFGSFLDKDSNATYPLLFSLSVVYFILVVLVLFSLQKTARKNSIVPS